MATLVLDTRVSYFAGMKFLQYSVFFLLLCLGWSAIAVMLALYGWWMSPVVARGDDQAFYQWASETLRTENRGSAAMVVLKQGRVFAEHYQPQATINNATLFPSASFSKLITALGIMRLHEQGQIDLDAPASRYLENWQLPASEFDHDKVTVRRLLSHTAGLTDGLGFGDYSADEVVPDTVATLRDPRASSGDKVIEVGIEPGSEYRYSGGGYLILQLLIEDVTGGSFADYIAHTILKPVGMQHSTYAYIADQDNATASFNSDGSVAPSYQYASPAATGFNTSAGDLTRLAQALVAEDEGTFSRDMLARMREPHGYVMGAAIWGLGTMLYAPSPGGDHVFGHDGGNEPALNSTLRINPDNADAIVVLVSGHPSLATKIGSEWVLWQTGYPDFLSTSRALTSAVLPIGVGVLVLLLLVLAIARRRSR